MELPKKKKKKKNKRKKDNDGCNPNALANGIDKGSLISRKMSRKF
jgi:hypothetical protein